MLEREIFRCTREELTAYRLNLSKVVERGLVRTKLQGEDGKVSPNKIDDLVRRIGRPCNTERIRRYLSADRVFADILSDRHSGEVRYIAQSYIDPRREEQCAWISVCRDPRTGSAVVAEYYDGSASWPQYRILRSETGRLLSAQRVGVADYIMG